MHPRPWEIQEFDDAISYSWFREFLILPRPRSLEKLVRLGAPYSPIELRQLAARDLWAERAQLWDQHQQDAAEQAIATSVRAELAQKWARFDRLATEQLEKHGLAAAQTPAPYFSVRDAIKLAEIAARQRMLIEGLPTETVATADLSKLTDEELDQYRRLALKAG